MTFQPPRSGPSNVAEYQASGLPWATSSNVTDLVWRVDFPYVTNGISIQAVSGTVRLGFTENGVNGTNYILLGSGNDYPTFDLRCKTIFVRSHTASTGTVSILAGLTQIQHRDFPVLTGSAIYNSSSVGNVFGYGLPFTVASGSGLG